MTTPVAKTLEYDNPQNSGKLFSELSAVDLRLRKQLDFLNFKFLTRIQAVAIPQMLMNPDRNVFICSQTGSGKTLAFLLPAIHRILTAEATKRETLVKNGLMAGDDKATVFNRVDGTRMLVLSPTRELATQTDQFVKKLVQTIYWITCNVLVSGAKKKGEKAALRKGVTILGATPGRILDHLNTTAAFRCHKLSSIIIDEVDRLLDLGFDSKLRKIVSDLRSKVLAEPPAKKRRISDEYEDSTSDDEVIKTPNYWDQYETNITLQVTMCSATLSNQVVKFADFCLSSEALQIRDVCNEDNGADEQKREVDISKARKLTVNSSVDWTVPNELKQSYILIENLKTKLLTLIALLLIRQGKKGSKTLVFTDTCETAEYLSNVLVELLWPTVPDDVPRALKKHQQKVSEKVKKVADSALDVDDILFNLDDEQHSMLMKSDTSMLFTEFKVFNDMRLFRLHGNINKDDRVGNTEAFCKELKRASVLFVTDVAARGLDFPDVDLVIQYDVPCELSDYVHRVGRTARLGKSGTSILFLNDHEVGFVDLLKAQNLFNEDCVCTHQDRILRTFKPSDKLSKLPSHLNTLRPSDSANFLLSRFSQYVSSKSTLMRMGAKAYFSSIKNYRTYSKELRKYFAAEKLHLGRLASSFFLRQSPRELVKREGGPNYNPLKPSRQESRGHIAVKKKYTKYKKRRP